MHKRFTAEGPDGTKMQLDAWTDDENGNHGLLAYTLSLRIGDLNVDVSSDKPIHGPGLMAGSPTGPSGRS